MIRHTLRHLAKEAHIDLAEASRAALDDLDPTRRPGVIHALTTEEGAFEDGMYYGALVQFLREVNASAEAEMAELLGTAPGPSDDDEDDDDEEEE